ncbi:hypothetical protein [Streptomyces katsurahamanus]|uniref:LPXTG cell wall anchor domain-containing protein n=1 Tax=Streptomyces katsurahamanus TaxID=2577098 RepID=A0ABW9NZC6_9ACTN|nr:hypothetical protein [Streptomyces katsurahamanus]MQS38670.1 hypothetical protein [Streptomyces katsurahamanus]
MRHQRTAVKRETSRISRLSIVLALSASALLSIAGPAGAAAIPDYQAALDAVKSPAVREAVCRFLSVPVPEGGSRTPLKVPEKADPCEGLPTFTIKDPVALNEITAGFVAGTAQPIATEAIKLSYLVSSLNVAVNGRNVTVMLGATQGGGWHLAAVRDGDSDTAYAGKATLGTLVFTEPQLRAWYQLKLTTVAPLNDQAKEGLDGKSSVSLSDYQKLVRARYADKLPGSDYDSKGLSSGYGTARESADASSSTPLIVGGASAALALAGGAFVLRRFRLRRRRDSTA